MKHILSTILLLGMGLTAAAVPAKKGPRTVVQPNGDTLTVWAHGDQTFHWLTDKDGHWVEQDAAGFYRQTRALSEDEVEERIRKTARYQGEQKATAARRVIKKTAVPLNIAPRGLVILVNYSDRAFETPYEEMKAMINGDNYERSYSYSYRTQHYSVHSEGSARQYFIDQSNGQYQPQFDVVGPYTMPNTLNYYGADSYYDTDANASQLIIDACKAADADVDFSRYDNDGDGEIDFVYVIYAGFGQADGGAANTIWPHTFWIRDGIGKIVRLDGKVLNTYACGNELEYLSKQHSGIGTFCHEFSHVLGLPDLYATNNSSHRTMCEWDIMDGGPYNNSGNTPPAYSAYERYFLGWMTPELLNKPATISMSEIQKSNKAFIITETGECNMVGNNPSPTKFYMVENRQKKGWDQYLPGHGMMITKVSYSYSSWTQNVVNNSKNSMGVDIIEADGKSTGSYGKAGDLFPLGADEYAPYEDYPITNIKESDGIIIFDFMGGADWISYLARETATDNDKKGREYTKIEGVYDVAGRLIQTEENLTELGPGMYIIKVGTEGEGKEHHSTGVKIYIRK